MRRWVVWDPRGDLVVPNEGEALLGAGSDSIALEKLFMVGRGDIKFNSTQGILYSAGLILESFILALTTVPGGILNILGQYLMNSNGDTLAQSSLGVSVVFNLIVHNSVLLATADRMGISWSQTFGAGAYNLTRVKFNQGAIVLVSTFALITLPLMLFSQEILYWCGVKEDLTIMTAQLINKMILVNLLENLHRFFETFCMAQGIESSISFASLGCLLVSGTAAVYFVRGLGLGLDGWILGRGLHEVLMLLISIYLMAKHTEPLTWGCASCDEIQKGLGTYFVESFKYALGSYTEQPWNSN